MRQQPREQFTLTANALFERVPGVDFGIQRIQHEIGGVTRGDRILRFNLGTTQAAIWLTAGDPAEAAASLAAAPALEGFGLWGRLERGLVTAVAAWASGDGVEANRLFAELRDRTSGYALFATRMARVLAEPTYCPTRIPRLLWCDGAAPQ